MLWRYGTEVKEAAYTWSILVPKKLETDQEGVRGLIGACLLDSGSLMESSTGYSELIGGFAHAEVMWSAFRTGLNVID